MVTEEDPPRPEQVDLARDELSERPLDGLPVDVAPARSGQDRDIRA